VGPFDTYDFGLGPVLIPGGQGASAGSSLTGYFQSFVTRHEDRANGGGTVPALGLKTVNGSPGTGDKYEITVAGQFDELITSASSSSTTFNITGGSAKLYLDGSPDFDFTLDSGFMDTAPILSGTVVGGTGVIVGGNSGFTTLDIRVDSFDANVYDPATITSGSSIFTLQLSTPADNPFLSNIQSVQTHTYNSNTDLLIAADGNLSLAVPEPLSLLLVGSAAIGLVVLRRRA